MGLRCFTSKQPKLGVTQELSTQGHQVPWQKCGTQSKKCKNPVIIVSLDCEGSRKCGNKYICGDSEQMIT